MREYGQEGSVVRRRMYDLALHWERQYGNSDHSSLLSGYFDMLGDMFAVVYSL